MKTLVKVRKDLQAAGRWDIDFHLPAEGIKAFPKGLLKRVDEVADIAQDKRDPGREPETAFQYIDISAVDVAIGLVSNPQDMEGAEAPSRARKVVRAFDIIVSTCRPTRGAIAVIPTRLHDQVASTAFSVVRPREGVNPFYLHYALRLPSTLEQFRKWSTGSSYPAILDSDVRKTLIPMPMTDIQDEIAVRVMFALRARAKVIRSANASWIKTLSEITASLNGETSAEQADEEAYEDFGAAFSTKEIQAVIRSLKPLKVDRISLADLDADLFGAEAAAD